MDTPLKSVISYIIFLVVSKFTRGKSAVESHAANQVSELRISICHIVNHTRIDSTIIYLVTAKFTI
jgi:hypothetical protein